MEKPIKLLDVVALTENLPEHKVVRGQVGTVVEILDSGVFIVEFSDNNGEAYAILTLKADQLMVLRYEPAKVSVK